MFILLVLAKIQAHPTQLMVKDLVLLLLKLLVLSLEMDLLSILVDPKRHTRLQVVRAACILVTVLARPTHLPLKTNQVDFPIPPLVQQILDFQFQHLQVSLDSLMVCLPLN